MKILVMAKAPVAGQVKTRLCPPLAAQEAADVAAAALADTLDRVVQCGADERWIALDGQPGEWLPPGFGVFAQRGLSFTDRLHHAWTRVDGPTLQIGMDTPQVSAQLLDDSCQALLDSPGAALGPATDGGWWALGLLRAHPGVFHGIPMSTPSTGLEQSERLRRLGLGPTLLPELADVDEWDHAVAVAREVPDGRFGRTVAGLAARLAGGSGADGEFEEVS
jgi:glycosyltransferase A (GT-A) superfamily protein (DUF2064 family)